MNLNSLKFDPMESEQSGGGVATATDPSVAGGDGGGEAAGNDAGGESTPGWEASPLPAGHWGHEKGFKTLGDLDKSYQSSSQEARRWSDEARQSQATAAQLERAYVEQLLQSGKNNQQQAAPDKNAVWGFPSREAYAAAYQHDPVATMEKTLLHYIDKSPAFVEKLLEKLSPELRTTLEPMQDRMKEQEHAQFVRSCEDTFAKFQTEWPNFKPGTPMYAQLDKELNSNPALARLARTDYQQALELAAARIERSVSRAQASANDQKLKETRRGAGSARPGAGGPTSPKGGTIADRIRTHAAESRAKGENVTEEQIENAIARATGVVGNAT